MLTAITIATGIGASVFLWLFVSMLFRTVVETNDVHIVQSSKKTTSYGKGKPAGNTYYAWPSFLPIIGVKVIRLPMSVFDVGLKGYSGYDVGRVPFVVDVMAFFRVTDSNVAAERVDTFDELKDQVHSILQGAIRTILAKTDIEHILENRGEFGEKFTKEVDHHLLEWGIQNVKTIELMDIRDEAGSQVIANIMAKKKSAIEKESRVAVASNIRAAEIAEVEAQRDVAISKQNASQAVGIRTAEAERDVQVSREKADQSIKDERRITTEKAMEVAKVEHVRKAEIARDVQIVQAQQDKETAIVRAEGEKQRTITMAEGDLAKTKLYAEGVQTEGIAQADALRARELAPIQAQIELAREIGENVGYQTYLVDIRKVEANERIGVEQAKALEAANIRILANSTGPSDGLADVMEMFSPKGGAKLAGMVETFRNSDVGGKILNAMTGEDGDKLDNPSPPPRSGSAPRNGSRA